MSPDGDEVATMRIPADAGRQFRRMPVTDSGPCRSPIPEHAGRGVTRVNPATVVPFSPGKGIDGGASEVTRAQGTRDIAAAGRGHERSADCDGDWPSI